MAKKKKSKAGRKRNDRSPRGKARSARSRHSNGRKPKSNGGFDDLEELSLVCQKFCSGYGAAEICRELRKHKITLNRERPYKILGRATRNRWIRFTPPLDLVLKEQLARQYPRLQGVTVVHTATAADVAYRGATSLLSILQRHYAGREVHIGFSGGHAMLDLAQNFGDLLREPAEALPKRIWFHALVSGFDVCEPFTNPNAFFTYFRKDPSMQVESRFVALYAPPVISSAQVGSIDRLEPIEEARSHVKDLDIVVTSASQATDAHNTLHKYIKPSEDQLRETNCVGDILWQPIGPQGPVRLNSEVQALTLMDLEALQAFVARRRIVLLVAGPCGTCLTPKTQVVKAILEQKEPLITHLVTDSRCASKLITMQEEDAAD